MPLRPQLVPRRRVTELRDPAYSGTGPPAPTNTLEPARLTLADAGDASGKHNTFSDLIKLLAPVLGLLAGGKKGLAAGTQFSVGYMGQEEKQREEQARARKEGLAEARQAEANRHAKELERLAQAKIDAAETARAEKEAAAEAKADAKEKAKSDLDKQKRQDETGATEILRPGWGGGPADPLIPTTSFVESKMAPQAQATLAKTRAASARLKREPRELRPRTTFKVVPDSTSKTGYRYYQTDETGRLTIPSQEAPQPRSDLRDFGENQGPGGTVVGPQATAKDSTNIQTAKRDTTKAAAEELKELYAIANTRSLTEPERARVKELRKTLGR